MTTQHEDPGRASESDALRTGTPGASKPPNTSNRSTAVDVGAQATDPLGRLPVVLRVGVTGHRRVDHPDDLRRDIDLAVDEIVDGLPPRARRGLQVIAVSSLAQGADTLLAEQVLARPDGALEVVLPLPSAHYAKDFTDPDDLSRFHKLLAAASRTEVATEGDPQGRARDRAYQAAGYAMADRSDVVVAVWDGKAERGAGGTAQVVRYIRDNHRPLVWLPTDGRHRIVENGFESGGAHWLTGLSTTDSDRLDAYNRIRVRPTRFAKAMRHETARLDPSSAGLPPGLLDPFLSWSLPAFIRADLVARRRQSWHVRIESALYVLAAVAVTVLAHEVAFRDSTEWTWVEVGALGLMLLGWWGGRHLRIHETWISSRYLAERLRGAIFLAYVDASGDETTVEADDDPVAGWTRRAFRCMWLRRPLPQVTEADVGPAQRLLANAWVGRQQQYFEATARRHRRRDDQLRTAVYVLFILGLGVAIVHAAGQLRGTGDELAGWIGITAPAWAAAIGGHLAQREHHRHATRYQHTSEVFDEMRRRMLNARNLREVRQIALAVDQVARRESGDWFGLVRLQDLELPA